jgi:predicted dehydrogenase
VDTNIERAETISHHFPRSSVFTNAEDAFRKADSNLTIVASPAGYHAEHSILALQNRNHVLCEKPMAATQSECAQMMQAAKYSGLYLGIGMTRRFYPSFTHAKHLIDRGELGRIIHFSHTEGAHYDWPVTTLANFQRSAGGGGVLMDIGPHVFDALLWLFSDLQVVSYLDDAISGVESTCTIRLNTPVCAGDVFLSWDMESTNELIITGTEAKVIVKLDQIDTLILSKSAKYYSIKPSVSFPSACKIWHNKSHVPKSYTECIYLQMIQFIRAIKLDEKFPVTGEDGRKVISLIEECYRIAEPIEMNWLPFFENSNHKRLHWKKVRCQL